jgi:DNA-binding response OmpR family regulator
MQKTAPALSAVIEQHRVDRALTAPPLRSNTEASLVATFSLLLRLTHAESRALVRLAKHDHVSREELHAAVSHDDHPVTGIKIVDVVIYRLRRKLSPFGIEVTTVRGQGYTLAESARDSLRKILGEYGQDVIAAAVPPGRSKSETPKDDLTPDAGAA